MIVCFVVLKAEGKLEVLGYDYELKGDEIERGARLYLYGKFKIVECDYDKIVVHFVATQPVEGRICVDEYTFKEEIVPIYCEVIENPEVDKEYIVSYTWKVEVPEFWNEMKIWLIVCSYSKCESDENIGCIYIDPCCRIVDNKCIKCYCVPPMAPIEYEIIGTKILHVYDPFNVSFKTEFLTAEKVKGTYSVYEITHGETLKTKVKVIGNHKVVKPWEAFDVEVWFLGQKTTKYIYMEYGEKEKEFEVEFPVNTCGKEEVHGICMDCPEGRCWCTTYTENFPGYPIEFIDYALGHVDTSFVVKVKKWYSPNPHGPLEKACNFWTINIKPVETEKIELRIEPDPPKLDKITKIYLDVYLKSPAIGEQYSKWLDSYIIYEEVTGKLCIEQPRTGYRWCWDILHGSAYPKCGEEKYTISREYFFSSLKWRCGEKIRIVAKVCDHYGREFEKTYETYLCHKPLTLEEAEIKIEVGKKEIVKGEKVKTKVKISRKK